MNAALLSCDPQDQGWGQGKQKESSSEPLSLQSGGASLKLWLLGVKSNFSSRTQLRCWLALACVKPPWLGSLNKGSQVLQRQVRPLPSSVTCCCSFSIQVVWPVVKNEVSGTIVPGFEF